MDPIEDMVEVRLREFAERVGPRTPGFPWHIESIRNSDHYSLDVLLVFALEGTLDEVLVIQVVAGRQPSPLWEIDMVGPTGRVEDRRSQAPDFGARARDDPGVVVRALRAFLSEIEREVEAQLLTFGAGGRSEHGE
jgi:hypothetical protein